jgi:lipopolysaccharide assembly protein A
MQQTGEGGILMDNDTTKHGNSMKHIEWWFLFAILVILLVTVFALTNATPAPVRFFFWTVEISLALLIFMSAAVGGVIAISLGFMKQMRYRKEYRQLEKQMKDLKNEKIRLETQIVELEAKLRSASRDSSATDRFESPNAPRRPQQDYDYDPLKQDSSE